MNVTLQIGSRDFHNRLASYAVRKIPNYSSVVTTIDGQEHVGNRNELYSITFSVFPTTVSDATSDYTVLSNRIVTAVFSDPYTSEELTKTMRVETEFNLNYALLSVTGNDYYIPQAITLRETSSM